MSHLCYRSPTKQVSAVLGADFPGAFFKADLCYILGLCHNVDVLGDDWMEYAVRGKLMVFSLAIILTLMLLIYLHFQPLEVVSRYRNPQPQVVDNYSYLVNLKPNIYKYECLNSYFITNNCGLTGKKKG